MSDPLKNLALSSILVLWVLACAEGAVLDGATPGADAGQTLSGSESEGPDDVTHSGDPGVNNSVGAGGSTGASASGGAEVGGSSNAGAAQTGGSGGVSESIAGGTSGGESAGGDGAGGGATGGNSAGGSSAGGSGGSAGEDGGGNSGAFAETAVILIDNVEIRADINGNVWNTYTFAAGTDGFGLSPYGSTPAVGSDVGAEELSALSTLTTTGDDGNPAPALRGEVPFSAPGEQIDFNRSLDGLEFNLTDYQVHVQIRLLSGGPVEANCPLDAWVYATSNNDAFHFISTSRVNLKDQNDWVTITLDLANPSDPTSSASFDITRVNQIGVQVFSGSGDCP